jgi:hypothetical protein
MDLNAYINKAIGKFYLKKSKRKKTKEQRLRYNIKQGIRLIKTGEYDERKRAHRILVNLASKHGYVDRKNKIVLKEIY